jgi:hypothetical protein
MKTIKTASRRQNAQKAPAGVYPIDINTGFLKRDRILLQHTQGSPLFIGFGRRAALVQQLTDAEALLKAGYNSDENRDGNGQWTSGGDSSSTSATAVAAPAFASGQFDTLGNLPKIASIFGRLGTLATEGLADLATTFVAPAAFLGAYIIPLRSGNVASGALPGHAGINYTYNDDSRVFALYDDNNEVLFTGTASGDGLIRTEDGDVIGRRVDGTVLIDANIIPDDETEAENSAQSRAQVQARAVATTSEPSLCPVPLPDRPGFKSTRSMAYQQYVNILVNPEHPLTPGLAVYFSNPETGKTVAFDDCYQTRGDPAEAKGPGIARMVQNAKMARFLAISFTKQAERQVDAAGGRPIDWYVDEPGAAEFFKKTFSLNPKLANINVITRPMTLGKFLSDYCLPVS